MLEMNLGSQEEYCRCFIRNTAEKLFLFSCYDNLIWLYSYLCAYALFFFFLLTNSLKVLVLQ